MRFDEIREQMENLIDELEETRNAIQSVWIDSVDDDIFEDGFDAILDLRNAIDETVTRIENSIRKAL